MNRTDILNDIEQLQIEAENQGFKGINEYDLFLRESIADYIVEKLQQPVGGSLPMYDVEELNEIIKLFNNREIDLYTCIGRVWNKAYFIGANEGMKAGQLGNDR